VILLADEARHVDRDGCRVGQSQVPPYLQRGRPPSTRRWICRSARRSLGGIDPVPVKDLGHCSEWPRCGRPAARTGAPQVEDHTAVTTSGRRASARTTPAMVSAWGRARGRWRVMAELGRTRERRASDSGSPRHFAYANPARSEPLSELGASGRHHEPAPSRRPLPLTREQPYLPLSTPPLTPGGDVHQRVVTSSGGFHGGARPGGAGAPLPVRRRPEATELTQLNGLCR